jgi:hypothetical protein
MTPTLPVLDSLAAFVDVGSEQRYVSIAGGPPEVFGTVTTELHRLRDWLQERGVKSSALEAPFPPRPGGESGRWQISRRRKNSPKSSPYVGSYRVLQEPLWLAVYGRVTNAMGVPPKKRPQRY